MLASVSASRTGWPPATVAQRRDVRLRALRQRRGRHCAVPLCPPVKSSQAGLKCHVRAGRALQRSAECAAPPSDTAAAAELRPTVDRTRLCVQATAAVWRFAGLAAQLNSCSACRRAVWSNNAAQRPPKRYHCIIEARTAPLQRRHAGRRTARRLFQLSCGPAARRFSRATQP